MKNFNLKIRTVFKFGAKNIILMRKDVNLKYLSLKKVRLNRFKIDGEIAYSSKIQKYFLGLFLRLWI